MGASLTVRLCLGLALAATVARADTSPWTSSDYVDLYFRYYNGHAPLPHLREKAQKALFNHLIDPGNISRIEAAPVSTDEKLRQLRIILAVLGACRGAYNAAVIIGEPLEQELTLVQVHSLEVADAVAGLTQKSAHDPGSPTAWATLVGGVIESVGEGARYSPAQSAVMANALSLHYPAISAVLPEDERRRLRKQVLNLSNAGNDAALREALARMKRAVLK
jgi:hypothetical protein